MASSHRTETEVVVGSSPQALAPERRLGVVQKLTRQVLAGRIDDARLSELPPAIKKRILVEAKRILADQPTGSPLPKSGAFNALYDLAAQLRESTGSPKTTQARQLAIARRNQAALSPDLIEPLLTTGDKRPLMEALTRVPRPGRPEVFSAIAAIALSRFDAGRIDGGQLAQTVKGLTALDDTADVDRKTGRRRRALSLTSGIMTQLEENEEAMAAVIPRLDTKTLIALNCPGLEYCTPRQVAGIIGNMTHFIHPPNDLEPADDRTASPPLPGIFAINREKLDDNFGLRHDRLTTLIALVLARAETAGILEDPIDRENEFMFPAQVLERLLHNWRPGEKMPRTVQVLIDLAAYGGNKPAAEFLIQHPDTNQALSDATGPFDPLEEE